MRGGRWAVLVAVTVGIGGPRSAQGQGTMIRATDVLEERFELGAGRVWVLEAGRLLVFDAEGREERVIGREGAGPGEFLLAGRVWVDSVVRVVDPRLTRETVFTIEGEFESTRGFELSGIAAGSMVPLRGADLVVTTPRFTLQASSHDPHANVILRREAGVDTLASIRSSGGMWSTGVAYGVFDTGLGAGGAWSVSGDSLIVLVDGYSGAIEWRCAPSLGVCGRGVLAVDVEAEAPDRGELLRRASGATDQGLREDGIVDHPEQSSMARAGVLSADGQRLWVQMDGGWEGGRRFAIVDREGEHRVTMEFGTAVTVHAVDDDGVLIERRGQVGETVVAYLRWTGRAY